MNEIEKSLEVKNSDYQLNNPEELEEIENIISEEFGQDPSQYIINEELRDTILEIRLDPEYIRLKNTPLELINSTRDLNYKLYQQVRDYNLKNPIKPDLVLTTEEKEKEIIRCKYDILYYCQYVEVSTVSGFLDYDLNDDLRLVLRLFEASVLTYFMSSRQSGKTFTNMVAISWYFSFWSKSNMITLNLDVSSNKKNLREVINIIERLPKYMNTMIVDDRVVSNVFEKINIIGSQISGLVVDRESNETTGRGRTGFLYLDEVAYIKGITLAHPSLTFIYNTYSNIAQRTYTPAPYVQSSTPSDIMSEPGEFWFTQWNNASVISFASIKDLLPFEIKKYLLKQNITSVKIEQYWYRFPRRALNFTQEELYSREFEIKYHDLLMDINTPIDQIAHVDEGLANWMAQTRSIIHTQGKLKQEVYSMFLTANSSSIFSEEEAEMIDSSKMTPIEIIDINIHYLEKDYTFDFYIYSNLILEEDANFYRYFGTWDIAYSQQGHGDKVAFVVIDRFDNNKIVAAFNARVQKLKLVKLIIEVIVLKIFNERIAFNIESNSMGIAVIESVLEVPKLKARLFYENYIPQEKFNKKVKDLDKRIFGLATTKGNRDIMLGLLISYVIETPEFIRDRTLIGELLTLIEKNNKIQASTGAHDDMVMSLAITLYVITYKKDYINKISRSLLSKVQSSDIISHVLNDDKIHEESMKRNLALERKDSLHKQYEDEFAAVAKMSGNMNQFQQLAFLNSED